MCWRPGAERALHVGRGAPQVRADRGVRIRGAQRLRTRAVGAEVQGGHAWASIEVKTGANGEKCHDQDKAYEDIQEKHHGRI